MLDLSHKYAVIGAGPVGLGIAKALQKNGIAYDQLEADDDVGGNWYHGVYGTAHIISSKKTTQYADFPMPDHYPDFPSGKQMLDYLRSYADHFNLRPNIQFETKVTMCLPVANGNWTVELENGERRLYRGVIVCSGHHWARRFPEYPGEFTGELIHSKDYKHPEQLSGKRVLVIGGGNSACDLASEAARVGKSCSISLRRGYWFLPKTIFGVPLVEALPGWIPVSIERLILKAILRVSIGRYRDYGLPEPNHKIFQAHPTVNSELLHYLKHGKITPKPDVARYDGNRVHFTDGTSDEFDMVVCGTGYHLSFPFLPPGLVPVRGGLALVYGGSVLPDYKNIYIVGTSQARYGFGPLVTPASEMLCRMIRLQEQMELPIGLVMKESGVPLPETHLVNPHEALRRIRRAKWTLPLLLRKEKKLRSKLKETYVPRAIDPQFSPGKDVRVF